MRLIDPDGLFMGDRFKAVSDEARLYWPFFWCASNGYGRIELNPAKIIGRAFAAFKVPLSEERFWTLIVEYQEAFLLFLFESAGQFWGQWATSETYLPKYKRFEDEQSPAPNLAEFHQWRDAYHSQKRDKYNSSTVRGNIAEILLKRCRDISAPSVRVLDSIPVDRENLRTSSDVPVSEFSSIDNAPFESLRAGQFPESAQPARRARPGNASVSTKSDEWFAAEFWPLWPRQGK